MLIGVAANSTAISIPAWSARASPVGHLRIAHQLPIRYAATVAAAPQTRLVVIAAAYVPMPRKLTVCTTPG